MKELLKKISDLQGEIGTLSKDMENPFYKSRYLDINKIIAACRPLFIKHKLVLTQPIIEGSVLSIISCLESGESVKSEIKIPEITDPQKVGSCVTYYRRYTLVSLLALEAEDDDANEAVGKTDKQATKENEKEWLNPGTPKWNDAIKYLKGGGLISKIESGYKISAKNKEQLMSDAL